MQPEDNGVNITEVILSKDETTNARLMQMRLLANHQTAITLMEELHTCNKTLAHLTGEIEKIISYNKKIVLTEKDENGKAKHSNESLRELALNEALHANPAFIELKKGQDLAEDNKKSLMHKLEGLSKEKSMMTIVADLQIAIMGKTNKL